MSNSFKYNRIVFAIILNIIELNIFAHTRTLINTNAYKYINIIEFNIFAYTYIK